MAILRNFELCNAFIFRKDIERWKKRKYLRTGKLFAHLMSMTFLTAASTPFYECLTLRKKSCTVDKAGQIF